ncbi:MAG: hypothetical protein JST87_00355 [Bacteroidetes bacterium]|nr:hypothetical protein [Bacteroidota bacterium]
MNEDQQKEYLSNYLTHLNEVRFESQKTFEKQLSLIASGALGLSLTFVHQMIGDVEKIKFSCFLLTGWMLLVVTLLLNLSSHRVADAILRKSIFDIEQFVFRKVKYDENKHDKRNRLIAYMNNGSLATLIIGISLIIFFTFLNLQK